MDELSALGADTAIIDIRLLNLPLYDYNEGNIIYSEELIKVMNNIHSSNALILASPEYHGTVSAAFKNFIDYMEILKDYDPPYLTFKPAGCIAVGGGNNSGFFTLNTMINIVHTLRGITVSGNIAIPGIKKLFNENNILTDEAVKRRLKRLADEIYILANKLNH